LCGLGPLDDAAQFFALIRIKRKGIDGASHRGCWHKILLCIAIYETLD